MFARRAPSVQPILASLACVGLALPLGAYALLGLFSRYAADDYCTAGQVVEQGLIGMQGELYRAWSGRFSFTFVVGVLELLGPGVVVVLPTLALLAWIAVLTLVFAQAPLITGGWPRMLASMLLALAVVYATLGSTPDLGQSLLWQTGVLTYVLPLILACGFAGLVLARLRSGTAGAWGLLVAFALAFVVGGTSETSVIVLGAALGSALVLVLVVGDARTRRIAVPLLIAGLAGSVAALAIVAAAPGNVARGASHTPDLRQALTATLDDTRQFIHDWWRFTPASFAVVLLVPAGVAVLDPAPRSPVRGGRFWVAWLLAVLTGLVLVAVALFPSFYALGAPQPGRARIIPQFLIALTTAGGGYAIATLARQALPRLVRSPLVVGAASITLLGLMAVGPVRSTQQALSSVPTAQAWAARWDAIDLRLRAARLNGANEVSVPPLAMDGMIRGMDFLSRDGSDWLNVCVARYYGLRSVRSD